MRVTKHAKLLMVAAAAIAVGQISDSDARGGRGGGGRAGGGARTSVSRGSRSSIRAGIGCDASRYNGRSWAETPAQPATVMNARVKLRRVEFMVSNAVANVRGQNRQPALGAARTRVQLKRFAVQHSIGAVH